MDDGIPPMELHKYNKVEWTYDAGCDAGWVHADCMQMRGKARQVRLISTIAATILAFEYLDLLT